MRLQSADTDLTWCIGTESLQILESLKDRLWDSRCRFQGLLWRKNNRWYSDNTVVRGWILLTLGIDLSLRLFQGNMAARTDGNIALQHVLIVPSWPSLNKNPSMKDILGSSDHRVSSIFFKTYNIGDRHHHPRSSAAKNTSVLTLRSHVSTNIHTFQMIHRPTHNLWCMPSAPCRCVRVCDYKYLTYFTCSVKQTVQHRLSLLSLALALSLSLSLFLNLIAVLLPALTVFADKWMCGFSRG